jgi:hypothetical protein
MSIALFMGAHVYDLHRAGSLSTAALATWFTVLVLYVSSIVSGRLYTGMHGFLDVSVGIILGTIGWMLQRIVLPEVERWIVNSGWSGASLCPAHHLNVNPHTAFPNSSVDRDASLPSPSQPTPIAR